MTTRTTISHIKIPKILFFIIGIIMIIFGICFQIKDNKFFKSSVKAEATIVGYEEHTSLRDNGTTDTSYMPRITFTVNQQQYSGIVGVFYNSIPQTGEKIIIYYNPDNPADFKHKNQSYMGYIAIGFGILFFIRYSGSFISLFHRRKNQTFN